MHAPADPLLALPPVGRGPADAAQLTLGLGWYARRHEGRSMRPATSLIVLGLAAACLPGGGVELPTDGASVEAVTVVDSWVGLSPIAPVESRYELTATAEGVRGSARYSAGHDSCAREHTVDDIVVPRDRLTAFLAALRGVRVRRGAYEPRIRRTDDYPEITITVSFVDGRELGLYSASQGETRVPWRLRWGGDGFVVTSRHPHRAWTTLREVLPSDEPAGVIAAAIACD